MGKQKSKMNKRSQFIGAIFLLLFFSMIYRFYVLQVVEASFYMQQAESMYNRESVLPAKRGSFLDRNGVTLAKEATAYTVVAIITDKENVKDRVEDPLATAKALSPLLDMPVERLHEMLSSKSLYQVELRPGGWKVNRDKMEQIRDLELPGITFREETKRYYPNNVFASHVIGFLNRDGEAIMGLEKHLDDLLAGENGRIEFKKDNLGKRLPDGTKSIIHPQDGQDIYLTIDERIQFYVEQALDQAEEQYNPESMTVIVSRPKTGEILAMSSRPSFNPNDYSSITNYVNHAVFSTFEPGSTFKIITLAAAIEEGIYNGDEYYQSGTLRVPGGVVRDHVRGGWGKISFLEGVQKSSNVAFTILGWERMPKMTFYDYISRFGFGKETGIDLPHESKGFVKNPDTIPQIDLANMTFGQGVAVTPIQQVAAINAIANGGTLYQPYMIDRIEQEAGNVIEQKRPTVVEENVVSEETAKQVADILETVVTDGTGKNFYIDGYTVAGKTGTAQKPNPNGRGYITGKYVHSFIGFAPKDDPELVVFVAVDSPNVSHYSLGGSVVAQVFKHVMRNSLQYLSVVPNVEEEVIQPYHVEERIVEDYRNTSLMTARQKAEDEGFQVIILGEGTEVSEQLPEPGAAMVAGEHLYLITGKVNQTQIPDFTGWSLKAVMDWGSVSQVNIHKVGRGYVTAQSIQPGSTIHKGQSLTVHFESRYHQELEDDAAAADTATEDEGTADTATEDETTDSDE